MRITSHPRRAAEGSARRAHSAASERAAYGGAASHASRDTSAYPRRAARRRYIGCFLAIAIVSAG